MIETVGNTKDKITTEEYLNSLLKGRRLIKNNESTIYKIKKHEQNITSKTSRISNKRIPKFKRND